MIHMKRARVIYLWFVEMFSAINFLVMSGNLVIFTALHLS